MGSGGRSGRVAASPRRTSKLSCPWPSLFGARRLSRVVVGDDDPVEALGVIRHQSGVAGLGDGADAAGVFGEVLDLGAGAAGVRRDAHRSELRARVPGQDHFGAVVGVDQHLVAARHSLGPEPGCDAGDLVAKLPIAPALFGSVARLPDQEGMVGPCSAPVLEQPRDVLASHLEALDVFVVYACHRVLRSRAVLRAFSITDRSGWSPRATHVTPAAAALVCEADAAAGGRGIRAHSLGRTASPRRMCWRIAGASARGESSLHWRIRCGDVCCIKSCRWISGVAMALGVSALLVASATGRARRRDAADRRVRRWQGGAAGPARHGHRRRRQSLRRLVCSATTRFASPRMARFA